MSEMITWKNKKKENQVVSKDKQKEEQWSGKTFSH
jgi:hypothetical protein